MIRPEPHPLTFAEVDNLAFAAERGRLNGRAPTMAFASIEIGPLIELTQLAAGGLLPPPDCNPWVVLDGAAGFYSALATTRNQWICPKSSATGFIRTLLGPYVGATDWTAFGLAAQKAAVATGFRGVVAAQLVGALGEMHSNIYEHSGASETGIAAFRASGGIFEFVVTDRGMGALASLRTCTEFAGLKSHGEALRLALTEGVSRFGTDARRGLGFRSLFVGLANINGALRFRSGDHALTIDGHNPSLKLARLTQKPSLGGFFASVKCHVRALAS